MVHPDPSSRPSAPEILAIPFVCPSTEKSKVIKAQFNMVWNA